MSSKQVLFRSQAREKVLRGAAQPADAVPITLGPKSKSVLSQQEVAAPIVCNDGVTIAKEVELEDPEKNPGAQMVMDLDESGCGDLAGSLLSFQRATEWCRTRALNTSSAANTAVAARMPVPSRRSAKDYQRTQRFGQLIDNGHLPSRHKIQATLEGAGKRIAPTSAPKRQVWLPRPKC